MKKTNLHFRHVIWSCTVGNALEWYDFTVCGYFMTLLATLFFPQQDPIAGLLASWGVFASGFVMRPLGAVLFGRIGDSLGRKQALMWSVWLMAWPTFAMGLLPTYAMAGWVAPLLLTLIRIIQGLSIGGEFTGSMIFIVEHAPKHKRGFYGSLAPLSMLVGIFVGAMTATGLHTVLSEASLVSWGWRLPFLMSLLGSGIAVFMRRNLHESSEFHDSHPGRDHQPLIHVIKNHWRGMLLVFYIDIMVAVGFFIIVTFMAAYLEAFKGFSPRAALSIASVGIASFALSVPFAGAWSDFMPRHFLLLSASVAFIFLSLPLFGYISCQAIGVACVIHALLGHFMGVYFGPLPSLFVEMFPAPVRYTAISLPHNISMALLGGTAPAVCTWLIHSTHNHLAPAWYLTLAGLASFIGIISMRRTLPCKSSNESVR